MFFDEVTLEVRVTLCFETAAILVVQIPWVRLVAVVNFLDDEHADTRVGQPTSWALPFGQQGLVDLGH